MINTNVKTEAECREEILAMVDQDQNVDFTKFEIFFDSQAEIFDKAFNNLLEEKVIRIEGIQHSLSSNCPRRYDAKFKKVVRC